ncbi:MAG: hypothetical protein M1829_001541 [Trizodia sp. TS-e1964]|nr:MAG: hypothetical protein M1829_001541 [Trizodia sp. TS-e1964]
MADRFPSLEEFSAGHTETAGPSGLALDPSTSLDDDFLSREKAALGDDANQFSSMNDIYQPTVAEDEDEDLLGGGPALSGAAFHGSDNHGFDTAFPAISGQNELVAPGGTITGVGEPLRSTYSPGIPEEEENEVIKQWRERRDLELQHREEVSAARQQETIKAAQTAIDDFYENYNSKKDKTIALTRKEAEEFLASREDTAAGGTSWERIAKLVDLSGKGSRGGAAGTGKERFRELLNNLRKDEKAPGSTGY